MNGLCVAGEVRDSFPPVSSTKFQSVRKVICSEMFQQRAIAICYFNVVNLIGTLQLKICEVDVDDIAFGNFDTLRFMDTVGVVSWEILYTYRIEYIK